MKAVIERIDLIKLVPENDAERAMLASWSDSDIEPAGSEVIVGNGSVKLVGIRIQSQEKSIKNAVKINESNI